MRIFEKKIDCCLQFQFKRIYVKKLFFMSIFLIIIEQEITNPCPLIKIVNLSTSQLPNQQYYIFVHLFNNFTNLLYDKKSQKSEMSKQQDDLETPIINNSILIQQNDDFKDHEQNHLTPLEKLLYKVDGQGRYQFRSFIIFNLMWFITGWLLLGEAFFYDDSFTCRTIPDKDQCEDYVCSLSAQERLKEIFTHANSIVFAFQPNFLICELSGITTVLTSMIFVGSLIGFFVIPYFADNWGRKIAIRFSWALCTVGCAFIAFAGSPSMVGIGYFMAGFGANPAITLCYSFINQECLGKSRQRYGVIIQVLYAMGESTIGLLFIEQLGLSWRAIFYIILGLVLLVNVLLIYLVQTPKFLIKKSQKKTLMAFNQIAKRNMRPLLAIQQIEALKIQQQKDIDDSSSDEDDSGKNASNFSNDQINSQLKQDIQHRLRRREQIQTANLILLFKYKSLIWKSIGAGAGFLGIQVIYYSTSFNLDEAGYGKLINQQIIGVSQIFGYIFGQILISRVPRKKVSILGMMISSAMCLMLAFMNLFKDSNEEVVQILGIIGLIINRFVLCAFWAIFYVYIAQLFPTKVRSLAFGWASAIGTTGSTLSPYIIFFSKQIHLDTWILPGAIGLLSSLVMFKLPQTFKKPSQDFIQQQQQQRKRKKAQGN